LFEAANTIGKAEQPGRFEARTGGSLSADRREGPLCGRVPATAASQRAVRFSRWTREIAGSPAALSGE